MGLAIDTVVGKAVNPSTTLTALTMNGGDSLTVRNFTPPATATLEGIIRGGATKGKVRVRSPLLHDDTVGIKLATSENPSMYLVPEEYGQLLRPGDTLDVAVSGGTAESDLVALRIAYSDLPGAAARLFSWGDVSGIIANLHAFEVDVTNSATIGAWTDTVITTTDNVLKADTDYAILGFTTDTAQTVIGVRGTDWGNFRLGAPGLTSAEDTSDMFVSMSARHGTPHIPVFNANNRGNTFLSTADAVASSTPVVTLICAQLTQRLTT